MEWQSPHKLEPEGPVSGSTEPYARAAVPRIDTFSAMPESFSRGRWAHRSVALAATWRRSLCSSF